METYKDNALLDSMSIFLQNPQQREAIDRIIIEEIWPGAERAIEESDYEIVISPEKTLKDAIDDKRYPQTTKELVFLLDDPKRPMDTDPRRPWYYRCKIQCSASSYMIYSDFMVFFPESFSISKILRLLKDPHMRGCPPELSFQGNPSSNAIFIVSFTQGEGAGWGLRSTDDAEEHLYNVTKKNIDVINNVYELEKDYSNTRLFNQFHKSIIEAYETT
jgi:hypothetical protein